MSIRLKFTLALLLYLTFQSFFFAGVISRDIYHDPVPYLILESVASLMALGMVWTVMRSDR